MRARNREVKQVAVPVHLQHILNILVIRHNVDIYYSEQTRKRHQIP